MEHFLEAAHAKAATLATRRILTRAQIKAIAKTYDGQSGTIDELVKRFGLRRHQVIHAARRGGYRSQKRRKSWTPEEDRFLHEHWGRLDVEAIAEKLERSIQSITLRKKRLGISSRDFDDWTICDLEDAETGLGIDHRLWHRFIESGWLKCWEQPRRNAVPVIRVSIEDLHAFLASHPEVVDFAKVHRVAHGLLELDSLPLAPLYKLLTCRSDHGQDQVKPTAIGPKNHHGDVQLAPREHKFALDSCAARGGTDFWVPKFEEAPHCPRCGCLVSRFSEKVLYRDDDPDDAGNGHYVLMTRAELTRFHKRLAALESKGCRIKLQLYTGRKGRPAATTPLKLKSKAAGAPWLAWIGGDLRALGRAA